MKTPERARREMAPPTAYEDSRKSAVSGKENVFDVFFFRMSLKVRVQIQSCQSWSRGFGRSQILYSTGTSYSTSGGGGEGVTA